MWFLFTDIIAGSVSKYIYYVVQENSIADAATKVELISNVNPIAATCSCGCGAKRFIHKKGRSLPEITLDCRRRLYKHRLKGSKKFKEASLNLFMREEFVKINSNETSRDFITINNDRRITMEL